MLTVALLQKVKSYNNTAMFDELKWLFYFLNKGISIRQARKLLSEDEHWEPEVSSEEIEMDEFEY